jgi:hypothetical protein
MGAAHRVRDDEKGGEEGAAGEEVEKRVASAVGSPAVIGQHGGPEETQEEARGGVPGNGAAKQQRRASGEKSQG